MRHLKHFRWFAVLTLALAPASNTASAQGFDTLSINGTFHMDELSGTVGADLAQVFARDNEDWWQLTLYEVTCSYEEIYDYDYDIEHFITRVHATSFDFEFFGPDADVLNEVVSQQLTRSSLGNNVFLELRNVYSYGGFYPGDSSWDLGLLPLDEATGVSFFAGAWYRYLTGVWLPTDNNYNYGFPIVAPQRVTSQETSIADFRPGNSGALVSIGDAVDIGASAPPPPPPATPPALTIADGSVREGNRGTTWLDLTVSLSRYPDDVVTVDYQTADGTAKKKSDYTATSGTLLFWPDEISHTISIAIKADRKREPNETFTVRLSNAVGATIDDGVATATILNDD